MAVRPIDPPRSRSDTDAPQQFRVTPRVCSWLADVGRFSILSSEQIARRDGGSRQKVIRGLQGCVEHGLLKRVGSTEPALTSFFDVRPRAFALTTKGARCLAQAGMPLNAPPSRAEVLIQHTIDTAEAMFSFDAAVASHGGLRLVDQPDLLPHLPAATRKRSKPFQLSVTVHPTDFPHLKTRVGKRLIPLIKESTDLFVECDRLFVLAQADGSGWSYAMELDRGTEDIYARTLKNKATYLRKLLAYTASWSAEKHIQQWGDFCKAFRVLNVTTSDTRARHMVNAQMEIGGPAGLFAFTTLERLTKQGALAPIWINGVRDNFSILDRS